MANETARAPSVSAHSGGIPLSEDDVLLQHGSFTLGFSGTSLSLTPADGMALSTPSLTFQNNTLTVMGSTTAVTLTGLPAQSGLPRKSNGHDLRIRANGYCIFAETWHAEATNDTTAIDLTDATFGCGEAEANASAVHMAFSTQSRGPSFDPVGHLESIVIKNGALDVTGRGTITVGEFVLTWDGSAVSVAATDIGVPLGAARTPRLHETIKSLVDSDPVRFSAYGTIVDDWRRPQDIGPLTFSIPKLADVTAFVRLSTDKPPRPKTADITITDHGALERMTQNIARRRGIPDNEIRAEMAGEAEALGLLFGLDDQSIQALAGFMEAGGRLRLQAAGLPETTAVGEGLSIPAFHDLELTASRP